MNIIKLRKNIYYSKENEILILDDTFSALKNIIEGTVDMIFADPPYFLSNDGITCHSGRMVSVNKGDWDKASTLEQKHNFNRKWIKSCKRVLKDNGTIWISGTLHNIYSIGMALEQEGFKIINNISKRFLKFAELKSVDVTIVKFLKSCINISLKFFERSGI